MPKMCSFAVQTWAPEKEKNSNFQAQTSVGEGGLGCPSLDIDMRIGFKLDVLL
jgi:hypothetical protein